jgi:hypothetical protein
MARQLTGVNSEKDNASMPGSIRRKPMNEHLGTVLRDTGLSRVAFQLEKLASPSIRMASRATQENALSLGTSKFGGHPDLPLDMFWPTWKDIPLAFIAQISLAEVHSLNVDGLLPASGILYFFYDADHVPVGYDPAWRGGWRVLYYNGEISNLQRVTVPTVLRQKEPTWMPEGQHYAACALTFSL